MKRVFMLVFALLLASTAFCQEASEHKLDAGLRLGLMNRFGGLTGRFYLSETNAIEAILSTPGFRGVVVTGMFQWHDNWQNVENLGWVFWGRSAFRLLGPCRSTI